jgi:hypothetical protein
MHVIDVPAHQLVAELNDVLMKQLQLRPDWCALGTAARDENTSHENRRRRK